MIKILTILVILFPVLAFAGTEVLDPDGDIRIETDWVSTPTLTQANVVTSDDDDASYMEMYDNNNVGNDFLMTFEGSAVTDSTIDSVNIVWRWQASNTGNTWAVIDSISDQTAGLRQSSTIVAASARTLYQDSISYSSPPDGGSYSWSDISDMNIGVTNVAMSNNKYEQIYELWAVVYYHAEGEPPAGIPPAQIISTKIY